jgi:hypothetical protein
MFDGTGRVKIESHVRRCFAFIQSDITKRYQTQWIASRGACPVKRRVGEMMAEQRETVGLASGARGIGPIAGPNRTHNDKASLSSAGIDKHLADRARKYAAIPKQKFEAILNERPRPDYPGFSVRRVDHACLTLFPHVLLLFELETSRRS